MHAAALKLRADMKIARVATTDAIPAKGTRCCSPVAFASHKLGMKQGGCMFQPNGHSKSFPRLEAPGCGLETPGCGLEACSLEAAAEVPLLEASAIEVYLAHTEIFRVAGVGAFHTSINFGGVEYSFNRKGIECRHPFASHTFARKGSRMEILRLGSTTVTGEELIYSLDPYFEAGTYDILYKNCNAFTDAALYFLFRERLDPQYSRIERLIKAGGPFTTSVINGVSATAGTGHYVANPRATNFCLQDAILACDSMHAAAAGACKKHSVDTSPPAGCRWTGWCCVQADEARGAEHIQAVELETNPPSETRLLVKAKSPKERKRSVSVPSRLSLLRPTSPASCMRPPIATCATPVQPHERRQCLI